MFVLFRTDSLEKPFCSWQKRDAGVAGAGAGADAAGTLAVRRILKNVYSKLLRMEN